MLKSIEISNFILVDHTRIGFGSGLNIITGETGAGKSILINAISQLCGERSNTDLIRSSENKAVVEAVVENNWALIENLVQTHQINITKNDIDIIIRKEIYASGSSRIFVNDSPVTLAILSQLSEPLFDLHGQHQHQRLLNPDHHISYLDDFASLDSKASYFSALLIEYNKAVKYKDDLKKQQAESYQKQDLYRFQGKELADSDLEAGEYESLLNEKKKMDNIEMLSQLSSSLNNLLYSGEVNAGDLLTKAEANLKQLVSYDQQFSPYTDSISSSREIVEEVGRFIEQYQNSLAFDSDRMEFLNQRINRIEFLLKKYQKESIEQLIEYKTNLENQLKHVEQFDEMIEQVDIEIKEKTDTIISSGKALRNLRKQAALNFEKMITDILNDVGLQHAQFKVDSNLKRNEQSVFLIDEVPCLPHKRGFDFIQFSIRSNPGEPVRPIHKVASGGEISRIMLAIKSALAEVDHVPVMVFDEIDAGISGKIAGIVGQKLSKLAESHQIICVTHLPQIASFASNHYRVNKYIDNGKTHIEVAPISKDQRIKEIATLLAGESVTLEAIDNARQLLRESEGMK